MPDVVAVELEAANPDDPTSRVLHENSWLEVVPTPPIPELIRAYGIDPGESAVLALALARKDCEVILDDRAGRRSAVALGIPCRGTVSIVLFAKEIGMIPAARPTLEFLRHSGMYLSDQVLESALALVGES